MLGRGNTATNKRFLKISGVAIFVFFIAFYTIPLPFSRSSQSTTINSYDISLASKDGTFEANDRDALCSSHGVLAYNPTSQNLHAHGRRKVYDLFMLNTELDWLEIRLHELASQVDYFVILESPTTFTGLPKKMYYEENKHKFEEFKDKISTLR